MVNGRETGELVRGSGWGGGWLGWMGGMDIVGGDREGGVGGGCEGAGWGSICNMRDQSRV